MTDLRSAIYDDINEYVALCEHYKEEVVTNKYGVDSYGKHAHKLKKRHLREVNRKRKRKK